MSLIQPLQDVFIDRALENLIQYKTLNPKPQTPKKTRPLDFSLLQAQEIRELTHSGEDLFYKRRSLDLRGGIRP